MSRKHVFQSSEGLVVKSLRGAVALNPSLRMHADSKSVYVRGQTDHTRVAVISGGGAGHEPAHAGYTGRGMLAASVSGDIFASPSASQIVNTIAFASTRGGASATPQKDVLVVINNYTGDRLNFGLAIEKAHSMWPNIGIESVVIADDVSLLARPSAVGPRGLAGNILVCKILGAFAERRNDLHTIKALGDAVVDNLASIGVGLEHCHVPGRTEESVHFPDCECEIGLGLHNEAGVKRTQTSSPQSLITEMIELIKCSRDGKRDNLPFFDPQDDYVLFLNNLGGMSQLEMGAILDETLTQLAAEQGITPVRNYLSQYMTSLNAPGFSISLLNVSRVERELSQSTESPVSVAQLIDDPTDALAWIGVRTCWPERRPERIGPDNKLQDEQGLESLLQDLLKSNSGKATEEGTIDWTAVDVSPIAVLKGVRGSCDAVLQSATEMTKFDTVVGDGDCGDTFANGARAVLRACDEIEPTLKLTDLGKIVSYFGEVLEKSMGGTAGALFAIFFTAWTQTLSRTTLTGNSYWLAASIRQALDTLAKYTPARPGDRTIMDALWPFAEALNSGKSLRDAAKAARGGAESTRGMQPRLGRAVYVVSDKDHDGLPPDPGAWGIAAIAEGFCTGYSS